MLDELCLTSCSHSACVKKTRNKLCLELDCEQNASLRTMVFSNQTGSINESWWSLSHFGSKHTCGEVCHCRIFNKKDPVQAYLIVRLWSGIVLESVELLSSPKDIHLFVQGTTFGRIHEEDVPKPKSWWKRFIGGKRLWQVFLQEQMIGTIELNYPVDKNTRLFLQLGEGILLPIGLARSWWKKETRLVIPLDATEINDSNLESLYFLLVIVFRTLILDLDFCTGS